MSAKHDSQSPSDLRQEGRGREYKRSRSHRERQKAGGGRYERKLIFWETHILTHTLNLFRHSLTVFSFSNAQQTFSVSTHLK